MAQQLGLTEIVGRVPQFKNWRHADRIRFFMWYLHVYRNRNYIKPVELSTCFEELGVGGPASVQPFLRAMANRKPKEALKKSEGYRLERHVLEQFNEQYGQRPSTVTLTHQLKALELKVADPAQRAYLDEALTCFRHKAFRAAIVMSWNLAYDHLLRWMLTDPARASAFNSRLGSLKNQTISSVQKLEDFSYLNEDRVIGTAKQAAVISNSLHKVLDEKLRRRNAVAHPGGIVVNDITAEEYVRDLLDNVVLALT